MKKDKEWLKGLINEEGIVVDMHLLDRLDSQYWKNENIKINKGRLFYLIDQLDEPKKPVIPQFVADERYEKHRNLVDELHKIYVAKNKDYGNSFGESVDEFGIIAGVIRIGDKYNRLKTLAKGHDPLVNDESMIDTLKDMANYCLLTVIELEEEK